MRREPLYPVRHKKIKQARIELNLSIRQLCSIIDIPASTYGKIELGLRGASIREIAILEEWLGFRPGEIIWQEAR